MKTDGGGVLDQGTAIAWTTGAGPREQPIDVRRIAGRLDGGRGADVGLLGRGPWGGHG